MKRETLGDLLKQLRNDKDLTQEELAEKAGVPLSSLRNYEQDHRTPDLAAAYRLAKALGVALEELGRAAGR